MVVKPLPIHHPVVNDENGYYCMTDKKKDVLPRMQFDTDYNDETWNVEVPIIQTS